MDKEKIHLSKIVFITYHSIRNYHKVNYLKQFVLKTNEQKDYLGHGMLPSRRVLVVLYV